VPHASVTAYLLLPKQPARPKPALLCLHGHAPAGKNVVAGVSGGLQVAFSAAAAGWAVAAARAATNEATSRGSDIRMDGLRGVAGVTSEAQHIGRDRWGSMRGQ